MPQNRRGVVSQPLKPSPASPFQALAEPPLPLTAHIVVFGVVPRDCGGCEEVKAAIRALDGIEAHLAAFREKRPLPSQKRLTPTQQQVE